MMKRKKKDALRAKEEIGVIYARYSAGSHQTEQSIEGQVRECTQYAQQHQIKIVHQYIDRRISGTTDNREQFLKMIADARENKFNVVITYKTDRFSRNRYDAAVYKRELQKNGVRIAYAKETIPDGPEGIILESLLEGLAEYYSAELRQKIERGMIESAHKGKALGPMLTGYKKGADGRYEIDEKLAPVIKMIFEQYCAGEPLKNIVQMAYSMGLRSRTGDVMGIERISAMIRNKKYMGLYEAYGVRIEHGMPAIVDEDLFYRAQERMEYNRIYKTAMAGRACSKADYLLSGKAYCGLCGASLVGYTAYGRKRVPYRYYACAGKLKRTCSKRFVNQRWLEKKVIEATRQKILQPQIVSQIIDAYMKLNEKGERNQAERDRISRRIKQLDKQITNLISAIADGMASESMKDRLECLERQKGRLIVEHNELKERPNITRQQIEFLFRSALKDSEGEKENQKKMIKIFVNSVFVYDDKLMIAYNLQGSDQAICSMVPVNDRGEEIRQLMGQRFSVHKHGMFTNQDQVPEHAVFFLCKNLSIIGLYQISVNGWCWSWTLTTKGRKKFRPFFCF